FARRRGIPGASSGSGLVRPALRRSTPAGEWTGPAADRCGGGGRPRCSRPTRRDRRGGPAHRAARLLRAPRVCPGGLAPVTVHAQAAATGPHGGDAEGADPMRPTQVCLVLIMVLVSAASAQRPDDPLVVDSGLVVRAWVGSVAARGRLL